MAKEKATDKFRVGVNLADGRRFEPGDAVPADITPKELAELKKMNAIEAATEAK
jgi:hypothetical protein